MGGFHKLLHSDVSSRPTRGGAVKRDSGLTPLPLPNPRRPLNHVPLWLTVIHK